MANITPELEKARAYICKVAESYGLDCYDTVFELVTYKEMNQIAAYGGFPVRYPHWRFGMEYEHLSKSYEYGLSKIYELVINNDPCYAYLLEGNMMVDQKLVMAHVYGHCDFFKNNDWFSHTNRKMMDEMANHATRIRRYMDRYGVEEVENFIDRCLSLDNLIDRYSPYVKTPPKEERPPEKPSDSFLLKVNRDYMADYINPPDFVREQREKKKEQEERAAKFPARPERDILAFLMNYAPLTAWQQDILAIIRDEAYYFSPQGMTKIMNEGWASYWHTTMMTRNILTDAEVIDYADHHSGTTAMSPTGFNPYKVGIELFREIEDRWNKGRFGKEWEECDDLREKANWDTQANLGRQKIFEVRKTFNDVTFIDTFLTEDFCVRNKMFVYQFNKRTNRYEINTRDFPLIKQKLLFQLTNWGQPIIRVEEGNFQNRGELLLTHLYEGIDLQPDYMTETLRNVHAMWSRPVHLVTAMDGEPRLVSFNGEKFNDQKLGGAPETPPTESSAS